MLCFAFIDPVASPTGDAPPWWTTRRAVYAVGFFFFWLVGLVARGTVLAARAPGTPWRLTSAFRSTAPDSLCTSRRRRSIRARSTGRFARLRVLSVWALLGIYYLLPWLTWNDRQAVLFDLPARKFFIFGLMFWPQDFIFLALLLIIAALALFFFTAIGGRLWCGYACPQTVWTETFLWIERSPKVTAARAQQARPRCRGTPTSWRASRPSSSCGSRSRSGPASPSSAIFTPIRSLGQEVLALLAGSVGDLLGRVLRLRHLRQRRLPARAGVQVHVSLRALPERDVRSRHADHHLRRRTRRAARRAQARHQSARARASATASTAPGACRCARPASTSARDCRSSASPAPPASTPATTSWTRWAARAG